MRPYYALLVFASAFLWQSWCRASTTQPSTRPAVVKAFLDEPDMEKSYTQLRVWRSLDGDAKKEIIKALMNELNSVSKVPLVNLKGWYIVPRPDAAKLQQHSGVIRHDVFVSGGKAAWAIDELLNVELPPVTENMTLDQIKNVEQFAYNCFAAYCRGTENR